MTVPLGLVSKQYTTPLADHRLVTLSVPVW